MISVLRTAFLVGMVILWQSNCLTMAVAQTQQPDLGNPPGEPLEIESTTSISEIQPPSGPLGVATSSSGILSIDVRSIVGKLLPCRVGIHDFTGKRVAEYELPTGEATIHHPSGEWSLYIHVYDKGVPLLTHVEKVRLSTGLEVKVAPRILEGSGENRTLRRFDRDLDMAIDRVELQMGTNPANAASVPGTDRYTWKSPVLNNEARWYRGELHAHSSYGVGSESVKELIRRAERERLDFLAIADRNTLDAAFDPNFKSKSVVLIPALEWGDDERGVGLILGPKTFPYVSESLPEAQAVLTRLQAQGGIFAIAHPCFSTAPWQWGLSYVNSVEAWCRPWREVPPLWLDRLDEGTLERKDGRLVHSLALATETQGYSANGQASIFYDIELTRGLKAGVIGGSNSMGRKTKLGEPLTYVYANDKSLSSILDGIRWGRTFVSQGKKGPRLMFKADVNLTGTINTGMGGYIPLNVPTRFYVGVEGAAGKVLEVLWNGRPFRSTHIEKDGIMEFTLTLDSYSVFRVRVIETPKEKGFGVVEMLAMSSPIYAIPVSHTTMDIKDNIWVEIESDFYRPTKGDQYVPGNPTTDGYRTIVPEWRF